MENFMSNKFILTITAFLLSTSIGIADSPKVVVDIAPVHSLVSKVMTGVGSPDLIIPAEASPHAYQLKPSNADSLENANLVFWVGKDLTPWLEKSLSSLASNASVSTLLDVNGIELLDFREGALFEAHDHGEHDDHDDHGKKDDHDDHGKGSHKAHGKHEGHSFEWAGVFELAKGTYNWSFSKVDGSYADPAMKMVILKASDIEAVEEKAEGLLESSSFETKKHNEQLVAQEKSFSLNFDSTKNKTVFKIKIEQSGKYTFFTEHMPFEFETDEHFLKDASGTDIEPTAQEPDGGHHDHASHDGHEGHDHGAHDPHAWLSPNIAKVWLNVIAAKMSEVDPQNAGIYFSNAKTAIEKLDNLIVEVKTILDPIKDKKFVVFHDAYQYFENDFDISASGAISLGDASDPSPARLAEVRKRVLNEGIECVLAEPQYKKGLVKAVIEETNSNTTVIDPLGVKLKPGPELYEQLIRNLATNLAGCF